MIENEDEADQGYPEIRSDGGVPTLPPDEAFDPERLKFTTASGEQLNLAVVGGDSIEEDAYIDGRYGGRRQYLTLEGEYDGPVGDGYYVFHSTLTQSEGSDRVEVPLWLAGSVSESGEDEQISVTDVEVLDDS